MNYDLAEIMVFSFIWKQLGVGEPNDKSKTEPPFLRFLRLQRETRELFEEVNLMKVNVFCFFAPHELIRTSKHLFINIDVMICIPIICSMSIQWAQWIMNSLLHIVMARARLNAAFRHVATSSSRALAKRRRSRWGARRAPPRRSASSSSPKCFPLSSSSSPPSRRSSRRCLRRRRRPPPTPRSSALFFKKHCHALSIHTIHLNNLLGWELLVHYTDSWGLLRL